MPNHQSECYILGKEDLFKQGFQQYCGLQPASHGASTNHVTSIQFLLLMTLYRISEEVTGHVLRQRAIPLPLG